MKTSNKIFFLLAVFTASTLTFHFVNNDLTFNSGSVLGKSDSKMDYEDDLDFSLDDLDDFLDEELDDDIDEISLDDIDSTHDDFYDTDEFDGISELEDELEAEIEAVEIEFEAATSPTTTRTTSKIQKLFLLVPVEIETTQVLTQSGKVVEEKQTFLSKVLDFFSF